MKKFIILRRTKYVTTDHVLRLIIVRHVQIIRETILIISVLHARITWTITSGYRLPKGSWYGSLEKQLEPIFKIT